MPFFHHSKHDCMIRNIDLKSNVSILSHGPETTFRTFNQLKNDKSISSLQNILILIFDKDSRRGADNRCHVPIIEAKI